MYEATWTENDETIVSAVGSTREEAVANTDAKLRQLCEQRGIDCVEDPPLQVSGENSDLIGCGMFIVGHIRQV